LYCFLTSLVVWAGRVVVFGMARWGGGWGAMLVLRRGIINSAEREG
jgi:hypothetical protein